MLTLKFLIEKTPFITWKDKEGNAGCEFFTIEELKEADEYNKKNGGIAIDFNSVKIFNFSHINWDNKKVYVTTRNEKMLFNNF